MLFIILAGWQSGYAAACKAVYSGSIPDSASKYLILKNSKYNKLLTGEAIVEPEWWNW